MLRILEVNTNMADKTLYVLGKKLKIWNIDTEGNLFYSPAEILNGQAML